VKGAAQGRMSSLFFVRRRSAPWAAPRTARPHPSRTRRCQRKSDVARTPETRCERGGEATPGPLPRERIQALSPGGDVRDLSTKKMRPRCNASVRDGALLVQPGGEPSWVACADARKVLRETRSGPERCSSDGVNQQN